MTGIQKEPEGETKVIKTLNTSTMPMNPLNDLKEWEDNESTADYVSVTPLIRESIYLFDRQTSPLE